MVRKKKMPLDFAEQKNRLQMSLLSHRENVHATHGVADDMEPLEDRLRKLLHIVETHKKRRGRMLFFVMYDIESDKVRTLVHKYLKRMGCTPVQRSIFLADTAVDVYERIKNDLVEVQTAYDNNDSIMVLPVSTDYLRMMKIIGKRIEVDVITHSRNTLFF